MWKRIIAVFVLTIAAFSLIGCGVGVTTTAGTNDTVATTERVFTLAELAQYDGTGGTTAYIAVYGIVYDVTDAPDWSNGWHKGMHLAGTDATAAFESSPHSLSFIQQLPVVGTLSD
jgi:predicted heme/steroid binding protein